MRRELKATAERARDDESRRLGEQIAQLDRQRSLGELSASLGHELNQPLTAAQVAKRGLQSGRFDTSQHTEFLDKIVHNTKQANQIIERIRGFIRPSALRSEMIDLNTLVREVAELIADEAQRCKVRFTFTVNAHQVLVAGDPIQLSQIVLNVFRNAIEAMTQMTLREIQVSCSNSDDRTILRIRDTGLGFRPDELDQVGTPFFTTKPKGLGMGLSISRSIAEQHGGTLSITNAVIKDGGGAIIELHLPAWQGMKR
jgi:signal transduction histidine kinase